VEGPFFFFFFGRAYGPSGRLARALILVFDMVPRSAELATFRWRDFSALSPGSSYLAQPFSLPQPLFPMILGVPVFFPPPPFENSSMERSRDCYQRPSVLCYVTPRCWESLRAPPLLWRVLDGNALFPFAPRTPLFCSSIFLLTRMTVDFFSVLFSLHLLLSSRFLLASV